MRGIVELVVEEAKALTQHVLGSTAHAVPPIFAEAYAPLVGIRRIVKMDLGGLDAVLLPEGDGYSIKVNSAHSSVRQNFSCAHEIGHVLLEKTLHASSPHAPEFRSPQALDGTLTERLCNRIAAELLMPESLFLNSLCHLGVSVNSIEPLTHIFYASSPAVARRIAEVSQEDCITLYWKLAKRPRWRESKPCLIWSAGNREFSDSPYELPKLVAVGQSSSVFRCLQTNSMLAEFETFALGNIRHPFYIESKAFGQNPYRYILSFVFPQRKKSSARQHHRKSETG